VAKTDWFAAALRHHQDGELEPAILAYKNHLKKASNDHFAVSNLGIALKQLGRIEESVAVCRQAVALKSDHANGWNNLGIALMAMDSRDEAIHAYRRATSLDPSFFESWSNLGIALTAQGLLPEALECFSKALAISPSYTESLVQFIHQSQQLCSWDGLDQPLSRLIAQIRRGSGEINPFALLSICVDPAELLLCARNYSAKVKKVAEKAAGGIRFSHEWKNHTRLRIGYLSGDFHTHATAYLTAQLFESHDRKRFEIYAYSYGTDDQSPMRKRLVNGFDHFIDLRGLGPKEAAKRINDDEIDILIDLKGYTHGAWTQVMALRPSPLQINYLGYPGSMGADFIDYIVVDRFIVPPGYERYYSEKCLLVPGSYQVNDSDRKISNESGTRVDHGLPAEGFVFCSFNQAVKITPDIFALWMSLLKQVEDSVLWLLAFNPYAEDNLRRYAIALGVSPERIIFAPKLELTQHLARYRHADLFLDTFPCNAHTTASDALWGGCPLITIAGETFASRVAGSLLSALGMDELIGRSFEEYKKLALNLAKEPKIIADYRQQCGGSMSKKKSEIKESESVTPAAEGNVAPVLYQKIEALSAAAHGDLMLLPPNGFSYAASSNAFPLTINEFSLASRDYPIVFSGSEVPGPIMIVGINRDENLFVDKNGSWAKGKYVPAYVHRYPFIFIQTPDKSKLAIGLDVASERLSKDGKGEPLFVGGQPGAIMREVINFMSKLQEQHNITSEFTSALIENDMLVPVRVDITNKEGGKIPLDGFAIIDEGKFNGLADDIFLAWRKKGWISLVYAHFASLGNWSALTERL
jgi:predicted O-linked N-acetylglucosamine transferase (SPINDLY family)